MNTATALVGQPDSCTKNENDDCIAFPFISTPSSNLNRIIIGFRHHFKLEDIKIHSETGEFYYITYESKLVSKGHNYYGCIAGTCDLMQGQDQYKRISTHEPISSLTEENSAYGSIAISKKGCISKLYPLCRSALNMAKYNPTLRNHLAYNNCPTHFHVPASIVTKDITTPTKLHKLSFVKPKKEAFPEAPPKNWCLVKSEEEEDSLYWAINRKEILNTFNTKNINDSKVIVPCGIDDSFDSTNGCQSTISNIFSDNVINKEKSSFWNYLCSLIGCE